MKKISKRIIGVNFFGAVGYWLTALAWVLLLSVVIVVLIQSSVITTVTPPVTSVPAAQDHTPPSDLAVITSYLFAAVMVMLSIVLLLVSPYLIGKWSSRILHYLLSKTKIVATNHNLLLVKSSVATVPALGFLVIYIALHPGSMIFATIYITTVVTTVLALGFFIMQFVAARIFTVPDKKIW